MFPRDNYNAIWRNDVFRLHHSHNSKRFSQATACHFTSVKKSGQIQPYLKRLRLGQVRLCQIRLGQLRLGLVMLCYGRLGQSIRIPKFGVSNTAESVIVISSMNPCRFHSIPFYSIPLLNRLQFNSVLYTNGFSRTRATKEKKSDSHWKRFENSVVLYIEKCYFCI